MNWIAIDWGTTHLRAWLMSEGREILEARHSNQGVATLKLFFSIYNNINLGKKQGKLTWQNVQH